VFRTRRSFEVTTEHTTLTPISCYQTVSADRMSGNQVTVGNKRTRNEALVSDMLCVTLLEVPEYLRKGELFHHFKQNESTEVQDDRLLVPADCYKQGDNVHNVCKLLWLLRSLRYWVVAELPSSVIILLSSFTDPARSYVTLRKAFQQ
jgi:hypothetical protein